MKKRSLFWREKICAYIRLNEGPLSPEGLEPLVVAKNEEKIFLGKSFFLNQNLEYIERHY